jgi:hypothetical protein
MRSSSTTRFARCGPAGACTVDARRLVERAAGGAWPQDQDLRIVACDYASGERVEFGLRARRRAPAFADLAAMGPNLMARDRRVHAIEAGRASTERALRRPGRKRLRKVGLAPS